MVMKHDQLEAYVIHARPFRETSLLLEFFSKSLGRCSAIAKGAYRGKSPSKILLQAFNFLSISLQGRTELLTLTQVERIGQPYYLQGQALVCGLYLNELLYYTLPRHDPHPDLFDAYHRALTQLAGTQSPAKTLRMFEITLLEELGYGINFDAIGESAYYRYDPEQGFQEVSENFANAHDCFSVASLKRIAEKDWQAAETLNALKRLTRQALMPLLQGKEIRSRELL